MKSIVELARYLTNGEVSARDLVEACLDRISDASGEGGRAFLAVAAERARDEATNIDGKRRAGVPVPRFAGIPLAVKDLFDIEGETTTAGSTVLGDSPPARADAAAVRHLRDAGFVVMGRTHMTEFAYSGLGLNSHHEAPRAPWNRAVGHIPGGSSSGSAVAVADEMSAVGLGTDTGGSCRIPAAFCGLVGFKPTARRVPTAGSVPLSPSLDSVGPIAASVECCAVVDDVLSGGDGEGTAALDAERVRLGVLGGHVLESLDPRVAGAFESAISRLSECGAEIDEVSFPELGRLGEITAGGGLVAAEAHRWHRSLLERRSGEYDPAVRVRIEAGAEISAADYLAMVEARTVLVEATSHRIGDRHAFVLPTVAVVPPSFESFAQGDDYYRSINASCLRNTSVANVLDAPAITLPLPGDVPVGLMLMAPPMADRPLLAAAAAVERILDPIR